MDSDTFEVISNFYEWLVKRSSGSVRAAMATDSAENFSIIESKALIVDLQEWITT